MSTSMEKQITKTVSKLLDRHTIDNITVSEITKVMDISRQTFYNHFSDLFGVFVYAVEEKVSSKKTSNECNTTSEIMKLANSLLASRKIVLAYFQSNYYYKVCEYIFNKCLEATTSTVGSVLDGYLSENDRDITCRHLAHGYTGMVLEWMFKSMDTDLRGTMTSIDNAILTSHKIHIEKSLADNLVCTSEKAID